MSSGCELHLERVRKIPPPPDPHNKTPHPSPSMLPRQFLQVPPICSAVHAANNNSYFLRRVSLVQLVRTDMHQISCICAVEQLVSGAPAAATQQLASRALSVQWIGAPGLLVVRLV